MGSHSQISGSQESLPSVGPPIVSHRPNKGKFLVGVIEVFAVVVFTNLK